jgi:hypothetical protein
MLTVANKNGSTPMHPDKSVVQWGCCRRKRPTEAVYSCLFHLMVVPTGGSSKRLFCFYGDSDTMRHVGGGVLKNPVTRASHSRGGGRIPRAGRLKQVWDNVSDDWLHTEDRRGVERTLVLTTVRLRFAQTFTTRGLHADN